MAVKLLELLRFRPRQRFRVTGGLHVEMPCKPGRAEFRHGCRIGAFSYINGHGRFWRTEIGRFCSIGPDVIVGAPEHPTERFTTHPLAFPAHIRFGGPQYATMILDDAPPEGRVTRIGHDVWIGARAFIRSGVHIGHGAVIGAHAVVTGDVPAYAVVSGVPARTMRYRFSPEVIERLLALEWWNFAVDRQVLGLHDVSGDDAVDRIEDAILAGRLVPLHVEPQFYA